MYKPNNNQQLSVGNKIAIRLLLSNGHKSDKLITENIESRREKSGTLPLLLPLLGERLRTQS